MPFTDKQNLSVLENIFVEEGVQFLENPQSIQNTKTRIYYSKTLI